MKQLLRNFVVFIFHFQHLESNLPTNLQQTYREEVNTDNEKVQEIARFSLRTLEKLSESNEPLELLEVIKARKQVISSIMYSQSSSYI